MPFFQNNLGHMLRRTAQKHPLKTALISHEGSQLTYSQLDLMSNRFANALVNKGVRKGDHIAALCLNCPEQLVVFFGIFKMGGVVVPINVRLAAAEMSWILNHSDSRALVFSEDFRQRVAQLEAELGGVSHYLMVGNKLPEEKGMPRFDSLLNQGSENEPRVEVGQEDEAFVIYTAGTTGRPKGVLLTHHGVLWNCVNWAYTGHYREQDMNLQVFPLYHVAAIGSVFTHIYVGGTVLLKKSFDPKDCMETIERERINRWSAAPTVFAKVLQLADIEKYDTRSVELIGSGAAIMPTEIQRRLRHIFPSAQLFDTYGMTEASGGITNLSTEDFDRKTACVGRAHISVEMRVVDEKGKDLPPGQVGEVVFRGPNLMKSYYKNPKATKEAIKDGWFHTGDLGRVDEEGFLYIVDRKKDMIVTGGENVYPREVEEVLYAHPRIADAAVIGVSDPTWGEAVTAVVVLRKGESATSEEIVDHCRKHIAGYKCPKSVVFIKALPKSPVGKILKRELREKLSV